MHDLGLTWFSGSIVIARRHWYIWSDCETEINAKYSKDRRQESTRGAIHLQKARIGCYNYNLV